MSDSYVSYWQGQRALRRRQNQQLAQVARQELGQMVELLRDVYRARRIILFGSLITGQFTAESDIDLAVAGLAAADFFTALADVNHLSAFNVDLKPLESLHPHFYRRVLSRGEIVYEATDSR